MLKEHERSDTVDRVLGRYPWLADEAISSDEDTESVPGGRTAPPPKKRSGTKKPQFSPAELQNRLPALRSTGSDGSRLRPVSYWVIAAGDTLTCSASWFLRRPLSLRASSKR